MNRQLRQAITAAGLLAVVAPMPAMAQGGQQRNPIFVASTFRSTGEPKLGMEVSEAVRARMIRLFRQPPRPGELRVVTLEEINNFLTNSGYPADSAVSTTDLRDLGKMMGASETMEGEVRRTADGVEVKARFYSLNNIAAPEVLPTVVGKDAGDAGRKVAEAFAQARKALPEYERCRNGLINNEIDPAKTAARAALQQYAGGVLPRACLLSAYMAELKTQRTKADSGRRLDSARVVAEEILTLDPTNTIAIGSLADAYGAAGDTAKMIEMNMKLFALDPSNTTQNTTIIGILMNAGAPSQAATVAKSLLQANPGDANIIEMHWKILQATGDWKGAIAAGEEMIKFDSSKADTTYFQRQFAAAVADSNPQLLLQYLGRATAKFPRNTRFWLGYSQELRRQGQIQQALDAAKKALAIDPKIPQGYATVLSLYASLGQADSAIAFGKLAVAAGADTASVGPALLTILKPSLAAAQASGNRADMETFYRMAATVDSVVPQPATAFYMAFAAYSISAGVLQDLQATARADRAKACEDLKLAGDMMLVVDLTMPRGGKFDPPNAAQILNASSGLKSYIGDQRKALACK